MGLARNRMQEKKRNENWALQSLQKECWRNTTILPSFENLTQQQNFFFAHYPVLWNRENSPEEKSANTLRHGMAALKDHLKSLHKEICLCKILTSSKMSFFLARRTGDWELCGLRQDAAVQAAGQWRRGMDFPSFNVHQPAGLVPKLWARLCREHPARKHCQSCICRIKYQQLHAFLNFSCMQVFVLLS